MMKVLIMDDDQIRVPTLEQLGRRFVGDENAEVTHSEVFQSNWDDYNLVMLDHDLGAGGDVYDHVREAYPQGYDGDAVILIHSMNPVGARNIYKQLGNRGIIFPYGRMLTILTEETAKI